MFTDDSQALMSLVTWLMKVKSCTIGSLRPSSRKGFSAVTWDSSFCGPPNLVIVNVCA